MPPHPTILILPIALSLLLVACSGDSPDDFDDRLTPESTGAIIEAGTLVPGEALTPRPGVVVDMATAQRYEAEGDIESAAASYVAIATTESPDRVTAGLSAARLLMESDDYEDARTLLEPLVSDQAGTTEGLTGVYLLGRAYSGLERWEDAVGQFDVYIASNGPATPFAYLDRSYALLELDRGFEAADSAQAGLNRGVPASVARTFLLQAAQSYERAGAFTEAIGFYNLLIAEGNLSGDTALALDRIAALKQLQGDPTWVDDRNRLLAEFPGSSQALAAVEKTEDAGEAIDPSVHGLILYRHGEYTQAEPHFREQIEASPEGPESALAYYYVGAILESRGEIDDALASYVAVDLYNRASPLADDALWWRARIHDQRGESETAAGLYFRIVSEYPDSEFAADASFRRGMLAYRAGDYVSAASIWREDLALTADDSEIQRLRLWQGKAESLSGQSSIASATLEPLLGANQDDYYGIRALGLASGQHEHPQATREGAVELSPVWDWAAAEQWLAGFTGVPGMSRTWETDVRWSRAQELWRVGRTLQGDLDVYDLIDAHGDDPSALYTLSRQLLDEGRVSMSARAGQRLLGLLDAKPSDGLPKAIMSLAYPTAFGPLVQRYADAEGISPLLMLAFIRQESFFEPRAISPVGALGLTQVLPETAQTLATELGITTGVPEEQLLHADLNLRLGARYMADQLARFNNNIFVALAAYNGGPTSAERWHAATGSDDADLFLETVEFAESRLYVEVVAENYAIYRYIYGGEAEPNLPR